MPRGPQPVGDILSEILARRGCARVQSVEALEAAWAKAAGELTAKYTQVGGLRRGALEITVSHSTLMQELRFQKEELLEKLAGQYPEGEIRDLRFRVGNVS
jgi:predicted nucleic acid-binding Zn ribbon protein